MPDENNSAPANNDGSQSPAPVVVDPKVGSDDSQGKIDQVELAKKVGQLEEENKTLKAYQAKVDPVIETIWSDQDLLNKTTEIHNKRLGVVVDKKEDPANPKPSEPSPIEKDNRNFAVSQVVKDFNGTHGFEKLTPDQQKDFNNRVGTALQEILDPMGNKTLSQIMQDVSVTKLPKFLDSAYEHAFREEIKAQAKAEGKREAEQESLGMIGSMPSTSPDTTQITLSLKEKETCKKAGWDEVKYLENKKAIAAKGNSIF